MLRVNLCKTEYLRVCQRTTVLLFYLMEICYFFRTQRQTFLLVVFLKIINILDWLWLQVDCENLLVQSVIHALQHWIVVSIL